MINTYLFIIFIMLSVMVMKAQSGFIQKDWEMLIEMRTEMKVRFEGIDKRYEQVDKYFEDANNRVGDLLYLFSIISGSFVTVAVAFASLTYQDRKTAQKEAIHKAEVLVEDQVSEIQKEGKLIDLIRALRELSKEDNKLKLVLRNYNLI